MASLNLDLNYLDNVKTLRLVARLGPGSAILPIALWLYAGKHHPEDGRLALLEAELEHVCGWWGEKGSLVPALVEIGFLKKSDDFYQINDWLDHSGHLAVFKKRAKNAAKKRWSKATESSNASSIAKAETKQCPSSAVTSSSVQSNPPTPLSASPASKSTARNGGLHQVGQVVSTLKDLRGKPILPEPEISDEDRMSAEEMEAIRLANMRPAKAVPVPIPGGEDDVF